MRAHNKAGLAIFLVCVMLWTSAFSCASAIIQLQRYVPIGIAAFDGAVNIISPLPGSPLQLDKVLVDEAWNVVNGAMTEYLNAPAIGKQTKLQELITALNAVQSGIGKTLQDFASGPVDEAVRAGLMLITATLQSLEAQLQPTPAAVAAKKSVKMATVKGTKFVLNGDPAKFKQQYNAIMVAGGHADHQLQ